MRILSAIIVFLAAFSAHRAEAGLPMRVISLGPAITKQIYFLEAQGSLVGVTTYCQLPPKDKAKPKIGTVLEINIEQIIRLNPDLVLATSLTNPRDIAKLETLEIKVIAFPQADGLEQITEQFLQLGRLLNQEKRARAIVAQAQEKVKLLKEQVAGLPKVRVFMQIGAKPLITVSDNSFLNELIEFAGGINIARGTKNGLYSREAVIQADPEVIIITTMGLAGEEEKAVWQNFSGLKAVQYNRIAIVDEYTFCSITPLDFAQALAEMVAILHP